MDQKLNYDVLTKSLAINHKQIAISLESPLMINKVYNDFRENGFAIERVMKKTPTLLMTTLSFIIIILSF